jgi:plastocyanin
MYINRLLGLALFGTLALGCGGNTNTAGNDMSVPRDMAMTTQPADMATADMASADMAMTFNGCTTFMDQSGQTASRTITFPGNVAGTFAYSPKCMQIAVGQMATWSGTLTAHPLRPGVGANATAGSPNNPITATNTGNSVSFTFPTAGVYPYNCSIHDSLGMNGAILVK